MIFTLLCFQVHWSDSGELCAIATDDTIYILKYNADKVAQAMENKDEITEDGVEDAFDVSIKIEIVHSPSITCDLAQLTNIGTCLYPGCWRNRRRCKDWFMGWRLFYLYKFRYIKISFFAKLFGHIYLYNVHLTIYNNIWFSFVVNRLNYYVGGEIVTIAHLDGLVFNLNPA